MRECVRATESACVRVVRLVVISSRVHTPLEKFENTALFLRLGLQSTLIRHENGAFGKRSAYWKNLKKPAFLFRVDKKRFENGDFRKRHHNNHVISLPWLMFPQTQMQNNCCDFKFLRHRAWPVWMENI